MLSIIGLKNYLESHKHVTMQELTRVFNEEPSTLLDLLQYFIRKKQIISKQLSAAKLCSKTCRGCKINNYRTARCFEWVG